MCGISASSRRRTGARGAAGCRLRGRCRQLTDARADNPWLAEGWVTVQQQAIRDHGQAMTRFFAGTHRRPSWRKAGRDEGFRVVAVKPSYVRRLNRKSGEVYVPKAGWVRFRWSRQVPGAKSFRVTRDRRGHWHVAFAHIPIQWRVRVPAMLSGSTAASLCLPRFPPARCCGFPACPPARPTACAAFRGSWPGPGADRVGAAGSRSRSRG